MKVCVRADDLRLVLQHDTALDLCSLEIIEGAERLIGESLVGQGPQALTGLQFGRIGWQEEQMDAFGHHQFFAGMPASLIEDQQDPLRWACADGLGELRQRKREHIRPHCRQEQPLRLSGSRLHKTVDVEPLEAMLDGHTRPGPFARPDPAQDRFEPNAMLIGRPQFDRGLGKRLLHRVHLLREFFLNASWAAGSALAWRGRSTRLL